MGAFTLDTSLPPYLRDEQRRIERFAREFGLDFYPTVFEMLSFDRMNEVAAYGGFPTRYPHWRFGMEFERLSKSHEYGLSRIYEMVINNVPSVAYLLEGNSMVDQKLVMAHVFAHVDFFKNNYAFGSTNQGKDPRDGSDVRKWVDTMANHGSVVRRWSQRVGHETVETFLDHCLCLENLIDPQEPFRPARPRDDSAGVETPAEAPPEELPLLRVERDYMKSFINPEEFVAEQRRKQAEERERNRTRAMEPLRDVLGFLLERAPLERWEHDCLEIVRREAYYFLPQMQTKIMNEGWATYWHSRLMTERVADGSEIVDYADRNAGVLATSQGSLNPYKLGVELYRSIEERWDRGRFGREWDGCDDAEERRNWDRRTGLGRDKIFEVRRIHNDVTFVDEFLTPEFVVDHQLYAFGFNTRRGRFEIETRQFEEVKTKLLGQLTNAGQPVIAVVDDNHQNRGELLLRHEHHGVDLRVDWAREVLAALVRIWKRPVEIHTVVEKRPTALRHDGKQHEQRTLV